VTNTPLPANNYTPIVAMTSQDLVFMQCGACAALVDPLNLTQHSDWHLQVAPGGTVVGPMGPPGPPGTINDLSGLADVVQRQVESLLSTALGSDNVEVKRLQYWVDGLYTLLGEEPVFKPDWEEDRKP
jgi:hypothetical protein